MGGHRIMLIKTDSPISGMPFQEASLRNFRRAAFHQSIFLRVGAGGVFCKKRPRSSFLSPILFEMPSQRKCRQGWPRN